MPKISSFAYDDMPSPSFWLSSPASKKMHSPTSMMSSPASKMSVTEFEKTPTKSEKSAIKSQISSPISEKSVTMSEKYTPAPLKSAHKAKTASVDSKCTTFSDIIRALDETHDRIASMGVTEMKQDRVDSLRVLESGHPKGTRLRAFDTKKYMKDYENGDITLHQIQVAANATKLPEEHRADWIAVNGSE
jgi:poly(A) polymerase Pap1